MWPTANAPRDAEQDADQAADQRQRHRLDQELAEDVARARADRHAQADLAGALGDRDQHDVHDADAADEQRHRGDRGEQDRQRRGSRPPAPPDLGEIAQREVVVLRRAAGGGAGAGGRAPARRSLRCSSPSSTLTQIAPTARCLASVVEPSTRLRAVSSGISTTSSWSVPISSGPCFSSTPTTGNGTSPDADRLADRVGRAEQVLDHGLAEHRDLGGAASSRRARSRALRRAPTRGPSRYSGVVPIDRGRPVAVAARSPARRRAPPGAAVDARESRG